MSDGLLLRKRFLRKYYSPAPVVVVNGPELEKKISCFWERLEARWLSELGELERLKKENPVSVGVCYSCHRDVFCRNDFVCWRSGSDGGGWVCKRCVARADGDEYRRRNR